MGKTDIMLLNIGFETFQNLVIIDSESFRIVGKTICFHICISYNKSTNIFLILDTLVCNYFHKNRAKYFLIKRNIIL